MTTRFAIAAFLTCTACAAQAEEFPHSGEVLPINLPFSETVKVEVIR